MSGDTEVRLAAIEAVLVAILSVTKDLDTAKSLQTACTEFYEASGDNPELKRAVTLLGNVGIMPIDRHD